MLREGGEEEGERGEPDLEETILEPSWCSSGAFPGLLSVLSGDFSAAVLPNCASADLFNSSSIPSVQPQSPTAFPQSLRVASFILSVLPVATTA